MARRQCKACPWKQGVDPFDIPNGYDVEKHRALKNTIAPPGVFVVGGALRIMACHETGGSAAELPCVGWLENQLGPGNNIALRLAVSLGRVDADVETVGPQHERLEDTLPDID